MNMKTILDIATLLGGLAAIWFFAERFLLLRRLWKRRQKRIARELAHLPWYLQPLSTLSRIQRILSAVFSAAGGLVAVILCLRFGYIGAFLGLLIPAAFVLLELIVDKIYALLNKGSYIGLGDFFEAASLFPILWVLFEIVLIIPYLISGRYLPSETGMAPIWMIAGTLAGLFIGLLEGRKRYNVHRYPSAHSV